MNDGRREIYLSKATDPDQQQGEIWGRYEIYKVMPYDVDETTLDCRFTTSTKLTMLVYRFLQITSIYVVISS